MMTTGREDFMAKMYFTNDIDGSIELDWCLQWKREILGWNDGMAVERVGLYGGGKRNHLLHFGTEISYPYAFINFLFKIILSFVIFYLPIASLVHPYSL